MFILSDRVVSLCRRCTVTAIIMYTSEMPVTIDNSAAFTSIQIQQSTFDPIHDAVNVTST
jgi:hypothetical protein